jgi:hypothetical protein
MTVTRQFVSTLLIAGFGSVVLAQAPALDLKFGLWENTIVTSIGGMAPPDTSKMPPEQAAKIAEAMKSMSGEKTMTSKSCLKKEDLAKDSFMMPNSANMTCTRTVTTNTRTQYVADVTCTGQQQMKGHIAIEAQSATAFAGSMKMASSAQGRSMDVSMKMTGKFLDADCGTVK